MGTYKAYKTDENLESSQGVWIDCGDAGKYLIRRAGGANERYRRILENKMTPVRQQIERRRLPEAKANRLLIEAFVEGVLVDWKDVTGPDEKPLEFNRANAIQLLEDLPDLFQDLQTAAGNAANFRAALLDDAGEALGNG